MNKSFIVSFLDRLGHKPELFVNQNERDTSYLGACTTIVLGIAILIIVLFYFIEFILGSGMTVVSSQDNVSQPLLFDDFNKLFMVRLLDNNGNTADPRILHFHATLLTFKEMNVTMNDVSLSPCTQALHNTALINLNNVNISHYYCLDPNQVVPLAYDEANNTGSYLTLFVTKCHNQSDVKNCLPKEEIEASLLKHTFYFTFNIENVKINHFNSTTPLVKSYYSNFIQLYPTIKYDYNMYYKYIEYKSDRGWLYNSWQQFTGFQFDESLTEKVAHTNSLEYDQPNTIGSFVFWVSSSMTNKHERSYPKIQSLIVSVSSMTKVCLVVGELFVKFFTTGSYYVSLFSTVQKKSESSKPTIRLSQELDQTQTIYFSKKSRINPCVSCQWNVLPKLNSKTLDVEMYKTRIAEFLSVENIIHKLFAIEIRARSSPEKKIDTSNTSNSIINSHHINTNLLHVKQPMTNAMRVKEWPKVN